MWFGVVCHLVVPGVLGIVQCAYQRCTIQAAIKDWVEFANKCELLNIAIVSSWWRVLTAQSFT